MIVAFSKIIGNIEPLTFHSHDYYEIYIFHQGNCRYIVDNKIINMSPGTILFMNGKAVHKAHVIGNPNNYVRSVVHFLPEFIEDLVEFLNCRYLLNTFEDNNTTVKINNKQNLETIEHMIKEIVDLSSTFDKHQTELKLCIIKLLFYISRVGKTDFPLKKIDEPEKIKYVEGIVDIIQENYTKQLSITEIAKEMNLSSSYTSRVFKVVTGYTIMEYLMDYRFSQTKYLLEISSNKTLKDIAMECGFTSSSHFSHFIKRRTGYSPSAFKDKLQKSSYMSPQALLQN